ncbi:MAG: preprotein translocase subunit SecE [Lachnospiraceae bacterium]|jgi:preprotein translocase subunit SecE
MANSNSNTGADKKKVSFFQGVKAEFKKIIWPDRSSLIKKTGLVVLVSVILGLLITVVDSVALKLFQLIIG